VKTPNVSERWRTIPRISLRKTHPIGSGIWAGTCLKGAVTVHEMGIAYSVLTAVDQGLQRYPGRRAAKVGVRIGEFAGVDTESLRSCFEAIVKSSNLAPLELDVECRGNSDELDLAYLELEEIER
jgi:hypothetical protein